MSRPINDKHAVEAVLFVLSYDQPFAASVVNAFLGLQESLRKEYPFFSKTNTVEVRLEDSQITEQRTSNTSGVLLQKPRPDGRQAWSLRAEGNTLIVTCFAYDRWTPVSIQAIRQLREVALIAEDAQNPLVSIALQVVDRFVASNAEGYEIGSVFNRKSRYLTKQAMESGSLWHIHQGWFEQRSTQPGRCLNILNLSTESTPAGLITTIDHTLQAQFNYGEPASKATDVSFLTSVFGDLHQCNKAMLADLLNAKQRKKIKL